MKTIAIAALLVTAPAIVVLAQEHSQQRRIEVKTVVEQEVEVPNENGEIELKRIVAGQVVPGDEVIYTIHAMNISDGPVRDVVITDRVPGDTKYREGSAIGDGTQITFSVDGGETYGIAKDLKVVEADGTVRSAVASDYTHIRWKFRDPLGPGESWYVQFRGTVLDYRTTISYSFGGRMAIRRSNMVMVPRETATVQFRHEVQ